MTLIRASILLVCLFSNAEAFRFASGSYSGNGADNRTITISATTTPPVADFQPDVVIIKCDTTTSLVWRTSAMIGDASMAHGSTGLLTNRVQALLSTGFQIGSNTAVNTSGVTCWYTALGVDVSDDLAVGFYDGTGVDDTNIVINPAFQPDMVWLQGTASSGGPHFKTSDMSSQTTCPTTSPNPCISTNNIQALNADGFQVGTSTNVNEDVQTYYYWAIKATANSVAETYTGDDADGHQITTIGMQPQTTFIKGGTTSAIIKFKDQVGDDSINFGGLVSFSGQIKFFLSNGFELGTSNTVNLAATTFYSYSIREPTPLGRRIGPIWLQ